MSSYSESQKAFSAQKGDTIYVFRFAETEENGWQNSWNPDMDRAIGYYGKVRDISSYGGY